MHQRPQFVFEPSKLAHRAGKEPKLCFKTFMVLTRDSSSPSSADSHPVTLLWRQQWLTL